MLRLFGTVLLSSSAFVASAVPIKWTLSNVKFTDGSTVTGNFILDAAAPIPGTGLTDFQILVTGGSVLPNILYTPSNPLTQVLVYTYPNSNGKNVEVVNPFGTRQSPAIPALELIYLELKPTYFLSDAGGVLPLDLTSSTAQLSNGEISYLTLPLASGSLVGVPVADVPEPGYSLFVLGSLTLAGVKTKKLIRLDKPPRALIT